MSETKSPYAGLTRRSFLKTTGAVAGVAAVAGTATPTLQALANDSEKKNPDAEPGTIKGVSCCNQACGGNCLLEATVENGKVIQILAGDLGDCTRICPRGASHAQRMYSSDRMKYPMRRTGERGGGEWERISWDEAISEIASRFQQVIDEYGSKAICFEMTSGYPSQLELGMMSRLRYVIGGTNVSYSWDHIGRMGLQWVMATDAKWSTSPKGIEGLPSNWAKAKSFIVWMTNPPWSNPHAWRYVLEAKVDHNAKIATIDPLFTPAAAQSDMHVALRPGSDTAFALGMCKVIIDKGWTNKEFMLEHTVAPFLVRSDTGLFLRASDAGIVSDDENAYVILVDGEPAILGVYPYQVPDMSGNATINGIECKTAYDMLVEHLEPYTPEYVAKVCDVPSEQVIEVANIYANDKPSTIVTGRNHWDNGVPWGHALAILAALTNGVIGEGNGVGEILVTVPSASSAGVMMPHDRTKMAKAGDIPQLMMENIMETGKWRGESYPIKALWVYCANPVNTIANQNDYIEHVIKKLDFIVCSDIVYSDSAKWADIVLPVSYWFEKEGVMPSTATPYINYNERLVEPAYECKSDAEIAIAVALAMGFEDEFDFSIDDAMDMMITSAGKNNGLTLDKLREEKIFKDLPEDYRQSYWYDAKFHTPSTRVEFYVENPVVRYDIGEEVDMSRYHLPSFEEPYEAWPTNPLFEKYPFVMLSQRGRWHLHSQYHTTPAMLELCPEPYVQINPHDAERLGIDTGDVVELYNDRGHAVVKAIVDSSMREGVITVEKGWSYDSFIDGNLQELTQNHVNPLHSNISYFDVLCAIRKYEGGNQ